VEAAPPVTLLLPNRDNAPVLDLVLERIAANTRYENFELLVVDDGSTDRTGEAARSFGDRVRALRQENAGVSAARNAGVRAAHGELLAFLDSDDRWSPEWLERMTGALSSAGADAVACAYRLIDADGLPVGTLRTSPTPTVESLLTFQGSVAPLGSSMLIRREAFDAIGWWDERLPLSQDWELLFRLVASERVFHYLDEPLTDYRQHAGSLTTSVDLLEHDMTRAFGIVFARDGKAWERLRRPAYARLHRMLAGSFAEAGRPARAVLHAARSAAYDPSAAPGLVRSALRRRAR
jgi:glycosyltransferase involved in cell wall biosynthesis